jgi:hypothetical protein
MDHHGTIVTSLPQPGVLSDQETYDIKQNIDQPLIENSCGLSDSYEGIIPKDVLLPVRTSEAGGTGKVEVVSH